MEKVIINQKTREAKLFSFVFQKEYLTYFLTAISGLFLVFSWFGLLKEQLGFDPAWVSIIISGVPIIKGAMTGLVTQGDIKAGLLVSIALIASVAAGEYFAAGEVAFIMMIGEILENRTVAKAKSGIKELLNVVPSVARVRRNGEELTVDVEDIKVGDLVLVKPGERIPVDGEVVSGRSSVCQAAVTGESMPIDKSYGDNVYVGSLNQLGALEIRATNVGEDTTLAKVVKMVEEAENNKAPVIRTADRWATWMVPSALLIAALVYIVTGNPIRAVTILIVFCPCALCLATPTAIMAGIGNAAKKGILVKSGVAMELSGKIDTVVFDKTGTLTIGKPEVTEIRCFGGIGESDLLKLVATAEKFSEHPLARAISRKALEYGIAVPDPDSFLVLLGHGVKAVAGDIHILVGSRKLMEQESVSILTEAEDFINICEQKGETVLLIAVDSTLIGAISVADPVKEDSAVAVKKLKKIGVREIWMITGDNQKVAASIALKTDINNYIGEQLPDDKGNAIKQLKKKGRHVAMVGDGINDAPALAMADVGIAMGVSGTDIAVQTSDIALMSDEINKIPVLIKLSRKVLHTININILVSMLINLFAIVLASIGIMGPIIGALVHNAGSVLVVFNSSRLIKYS
ncbi:MAG: heavy metal translocating P-type ATPase [Bacillota bacterium]